MTYRLLSAALSLAVFVGCNSDEAPSSPEEEMPDMAQGGAEAQGDETQQEEEQPAAPEQTIEERTVGYIATGYRNLDPAAYDLPALTHLCLAFANPQDGELAKFNGNEAAVRTLIEAAQEQGVKVLASIAGASGGEAVAAEITPDKVDAYVGALLDLIEEFNLDGIDVDLEGHNVNADYEPFVLKLSEALPEEQLLTVAVATWNGADFSDAALAQYDFINLMAYDSCGPWNDRACEHSTFADAQSQLDYWVNDRGIEPERMVLGVPFYGHCWGVNCSGQSMTWGEIIAAYPEQALETDLIEEEGLYLTFNSPATIAQKRNLGATYGGVMIWELGQDASGEDSLLATISEE